MADNVNRRSPRKRKGDHQEHIIPVVIEQDDDKDAALVTSTSDKVIVDDEESCNESICDSVKQMSIESEAMKDSSDEECPQIPENMLPSINVCEKLIIVYDCGLENDSTGFLLNGETYSANDVIKRSLCLFLANKSAIDKNHEFALVALKEDTAEWVKGFTNNILSITNELENLSNCDVKDTFDLDELFHVVNTKIRLPAVIDLYKIPPPFVVRLLFIYTRSTSRPIFTNKEVMQEVIESPYFIFDVLMTHEVPSKENDSAAIFKYLCSVDEKGTSYCFSVGRNVFDLHTAMAKLLAHPLQRPPQKVANYLINSKEA